MCSGALGSGAKHTDSFQPRGSEKAFGVGVLKGGRGEGTPEGWVPCVCAHARLSASVSLLSRFCDPR